MTTESNHDEAHEAEMEIVGEKLREGKLDSSKDVSVDLEAESLIDENEEEVQDSYEGGEQYDGEIEELPEGINSVSELIDRYYELSGDNEQKAEEDPTEKEEGEEEAHLSSAVFDRVTKEYHEIGGLSQKTFDALSEMGVPQSVIDTHLNGLEAMRELQTEQAYNSVGGKENYKELIDWAGNSLSEEQTNAFNQSIESNDINQFKLALVGLRALYEESNGRLSRDGTLRGNATSYSSNLFKSREELVEAMSDPRYEEDEAYRQEVANRLKDSRLFD